MTGGGLGSLFSVLAGTGTTRGHCRERELRAARFASPRWLLLPSLDPKRSLFSRRSAHA